MVICLEQGAVLHMAQLMPLPLTVSCSSKIQIGFTFLVPAHPSSPGQRAIRQMCVCVCDVCMFVCICALTVDVLCGLICQLPAPGPPKKRKRLGELGCQGAYFMPTETRALAVDRLTKASVVETHVGSLRPVNNENRGCISKLFT